MFSSLQRTSTAYHSFISFIIGKLYTPNGYWTHNLTQHLTLTREEVPFELQFIGRHQIPLHSMLLHFGSLKLFLCSIGDAVVFPESIIKFLCYFWLYESICLYHLSYPYMLAVDKDFEVFQCMLLEGLPIVYIFVNWLCYFYFIYICIW